MVASVVMWAVTGSIFALAFAALGPVTAIASFADSRIGARRTARREGRRFAADAVAVGSVIDARHDSERAAMAEATPSASAIVGRRGADPYRWKADAASPVFVTLGTGTVVSALQLERPPLGSAGSVAVESAIGELDARTRMLRSAPVVVDARLGIGVCGPPALAAGLARAVGVQLAWTLSPAEHRWTESGAAFGAEGAEGAEGPHWLAELPHERGAAAVHPGLVFGDGLALVAVAATEAELPGACRVVVRIDERSATIVQHPDRSRRRSLQPGLISIEAAITWARSARADAAREGLAVAASHLPSAVPLASMLRAEPTPVDRSLSAEVAVTATGVLTLDLVEHGPHAVIGGTTGSGKSELLVAWVLAMAAAHPPNRVNFLLVDFKGGSAFTPLSRLPHTVGIVTDLDETEAARALASLRAELGYRERTLAAAGARDIDGVEDLPRLVIVVDEFAAMISDHPDLHALFSDLAARGRSLGVHLVLCTQRPSGVVRDSVLANADLRISLRVNNRADSSAVVGTDAAARIPTQARGRGILSVAGAPPATAQFALASDADVDLVASRFSASPAPRRPWREPLPLVVALPDPVGVGIAFGLLDLPHEQRREVAVYDPHEHGNLLILGAPGSGKTVALSAIAAAAAVQWLPAGVAQAWDTVAKLENSVGGRLLLADDLDSLLARFPADHRAEFIDRFARLLRDGPGRGIRLVIAAQRPTADIQSLASLAPSRLFLRHSSRQDLVLAGGDGSKFADGLPPGAGLWCGNRVQVASVPASTPPPVPPRETELSPTRPLAIVSTRSGALAASLRANGRANGSVHELSGSVAAPGELVVSGGGGRSIVVGDPDEWQSRWGAIAALRQVADVLFDGCSVAEFRALTRSRELPPPLGGMGTPGGDGLCWRLDEHGGASRARLPDQARS